MTPTTHIWRTLTVAIIGAIVLASLAVVAQAPASAQTSQGRSVSGGLDFPDPHIVRGATRWWAYATNSAGQNVPTLSSADLINWRVEGDALSRVAPWGRGEVWAPAVEKIDGRWLMYFTDLRIDSTGQRRCLGIAIADNPAGPFNPLDTSLPCAAGSGGHIDAAPYQDTDGSWWLLYKNDSGGVPVIRSRKLTANGLTYASNESILVRATAQWEAGVNENPAMVRAADGTLHLFWSGNNWRTNNYATGHAICSSPAGPCVEDLVPWRFGIPGGAGGAAFTPILGGEKPGTALMIWHQWSGIEGYENGGRRVARLQPVEFSGNKTPTIGVNTTALVQPFTTTCNGLLATIVGTAKANKLIGTDQRDIIAGGPGKDTIKARGGNDLICGDQGDDTIIGGPGRDLLLGGNGDDKLDGSEGRDNLRGGKGNDTLKGGDGRDKLNGGKGADNLNGGKSKDNCTKAKEDSLRRC